MTGSAARALRSRRGGALGVLVGVMVIGAAGALAFMNAGRFLVAQDAFEHADMAVVLSGKPIERSLAARDLFRQGKIDRILIIPEPPRAVDTELVSLGLVNAGEPQWSERILAASGVPQDRFSFMISAANGTLEEAELVRKFAAGRPPFALVLITSPASSRRARFIFRRVLDPKQVTVYSYPASSDAFDAQRWWADPRSMLAVVTEYEKMLANAGTLLWRRLQREVERS